MELPSPRVEWKLELLPDYQSWRAYKRCYDIKDDGMHWVPLRGAFSSQAEAHAAVSTYIANRRPAFLDVEGREIPT
jgi:hypothetical protein